MTSLVLNNTAQVYIVKYLIPVASFGSISALLNQTFPFLGQLHL